MFSETGKLRARKKFSTRTRVCSKMFTLCNVLKIKCVVSLWNFFTAAYGYCFPIKREGRKEAVFRRIRKSWLKKKPLKIYLDKS